MAKFTHNKDLEKLLSASKDHRRRMQDTGEKIEKLFAQIQSESEQKQLLLLKDLTAETAAAKTSLQQTPPPPPPEI